MKDCSSDDISDKRLFIDAGVLRGMLWVDGWTCYGRKAECCWASSMAGTFRYSDLISHQGNLQFSYSLRSLFLSHIC